MAFAPINNCAAAFCIALVWPWPAWTRRLASPRLASFGLIAHRTGSPYSLALEMRAVCISSAINLRYTFTAPPKPVPDFQSSSFPVLGIRATPTLRSLNQPTWQWHTRLSQAPLLVNSLSRNQPFALHLVVPPRWRSEDPQNQTRNFY